MSLISDGFCITEVTSLAVWTCKFVKMISRTYSYTGLNDFSLSSIFMPLTLPLLSSKSAKNSSSSSERFSR